MLLEALLLGVIAGERMQQNAAARQVEAWDRELQRMEVWDGIEHQIKQHCSFYNKRIVPQERYFVYFGGDKSKCRYISMTDVTANRQYWQSGLSAEDYAIRHFLRKYETGTEWEDNRQIYMPYYHTERDLFLFDRNGEEIHFRVDRCYGRINKKDWDACRVLHRVGKGGKVDIEFTIHRA